MARRPRVVVEGGLYHVYNRVASEKRIFADPNEAIEFIEIVRDVKKRDGWTIFAWCGGGPGRVSFCRTSRDQEEDSRPPGGRRRDVALLR